MHLQGERVKRTRWIHTPKYVVAVEVETVIPIDDPSEPCYEAETIQLLKAMQEHAERGDEAFLKKHGKLYIAAEVA